MINGAVRLIHAVGACLLAHAGDLLKLAVSLIDFYDQRNKKNWFLISRLQESTLTY
jgi:hypothetical protein